MGFPFNQKYIPPLDLRLPIASKTMDDPEVMVTLLNMGGPRTNAQVKDFLKRVFNDPILIRFPLSKILQPFFAWLLVAWRGEATRKRYQLIGGYSPIYDSTKKQAEALRTELQRRGRKMDVTFSFNYAEPLPADTIREFKKANKKYFLPLSLYPHYSLATTGSNMHYLKKEASKNYPELQFLPLPSYYLHESYVQALCDRIREQLKPGESLDDFYLLFSAHGLPQYFLMKGDPYPFQIAQTTALVLQKLPRKDRWAICYQSDVGPLEWLKPTTEQTIRELAKRNITKVLIVPIAFVSDHIETICEIDIEYRQVAEKCGIEDFRMSKALECHPGFIQALADSVETMLPRSSSSKPVNREAAAYQAT